MAEEGENPKLPKEENDEKKADKKPAVEKYPEIAEPKDITGIPAKKP